MSVEVVLSGLTIGATMAGPILWWLVRIEHRLTKLETILAERTTPRGAAAPVVL